MRLRDLQVRDWLVTTSSRLHCVHKAGGKSPVLLVGTHADDERCSEEHLATTQGWCAGHPAFCPILWLTIKNNERLEKRYCSGRFPRVVGIHFVSCVTAKNMESLLAHLQTIIAAQEYIGQPLPSNYLELEKLLANHTKTHSPPIISWSDYQAFARLCRIEEEQDILAATSLLHNFGSLVHFPNDEKVFTLCQKT